MFVPSLLNDVLEELRVPVNTGFNTRGDYKWEESEEDYKIRIPAPGITKDKINISVEDDLLYIKLPKGEFSGERYFKAVVPKVANQEAIKAKMENGILFVTIPYTTPQKKKIDVSVN